MTGTGSIVSADADLVVGGACVIVGLDVIHHLVHGGEGKTDIAVSAAIIEGDAAGVGILQGGAGEQTLGTKPRSSYHFSGVSRKLPHR